MRCVSFLEIPLDQDGAPLTSNPSQSLDAIQKLDGMDPLLVIESEQVPQLIRAPTACEFLRARASP
jgi:hypothetical protein